MSFGYIGDTSTSVKQKVKNKGILTTQESFDLERQGFLGGSLELIQEENYSTNVASVDFLSIKENIYDVHLFTFKNVTSASNSNLRFQFYESGVLETASVYDFARQFQTTSGNSENNEENEDKLNTVNYASTSSTRVGNGYIYFYNLGISSKYSSMTFQATGGHTEDQFVFGGGYLPQASTVDGIRFLDGSGTFTNFNFKT